MPTYKKNPEEVVKLAASVLSEHPTHKPLLDHRVRIDYLFAYPNYNENEEPISDAIKHHGVKALGLCRKLSLKDRVKGNGDAEILVDYEWWKNAPEPQRRALLDHELHHLVVVVTKDGVLKRDDADRPVLKIRPYDFQVGWFAEIARRNGVHSQERIQASMAVSAFGQFFWPELSGHNAEATRFGKLEGKVSRQ